MLDVEKAFDDWINELRKNYYLDKKDILELRDHFVDEVEDLVNERNISVEEAFQIAITNIGSLGELGKEYEKVNNTSFKTILGFIKRNSMKLSLSVVIVGLFTLLIIICMNASFLPHNHTTNSVSKWRKIGMGYDFNLLNNIIFPWQDINEEVWGSKESPMPTKPLFWTDIYVSFTENKFFDIDSEIINMYHISKLTSSNSNYTEYTKFTSVINSDGDSMYEYYAVIDDNGCIWIDEDGKFNYSNIIDKSNIENIKKLNSLNYNINDIYNYFTKLNSIDQNNTLGPYKIGDRVILKPYIYEDLDVVKTFKIGMIKDNDEYYLLLFEIPMQKEQKSIFEYYIDKLKFIKPKKT
jgi:hypothetical protein